ncbi:hypothetical protein DERF_001717 [Dermatophagoides farinae]|uniref:C2H2-type domain-containing protein n=1 Tax=Dermatophagoides farinae TaxID=6954 RepID=A0A922L9X2_DERFA|nr:hypothetical protein DERF_001717 [Dermatophagoides farinae]
MPLNSSSSSEVEVTSVVCSFDKAFFIVLAQHVAAAFAFNRWCSHSIEHRKTLQKDMKIVGYRCDWPECEFLTCRKYVMVNHINGKHTNQRPYSCDMRNFTFVKRYFLKAHMYKVHKRRMSLDDRKDQHDMCCTAERAKAARGLVRCTVCTGASAGPGYNTQVMADPAVPNRKPEAKRRA